VCIYYYYGNNVSDPGIGVHDVVGQLRNVSAGRQMRAMLISLDINSSEYATARCDVTTRVACNPWIAPRAARVGTGQEIQLCVAAAAAED